MTFNLELITEVIYIQNGSRYEFTSIAANSSGNGREGNGGRSKKLGE